MLKRLLVCILILLFAVPSLAANLPSEKAKGVGIISPEMPTSEDLIHEAYQGLIVWTVNRGRYTANRDGSKMKYHRLVEVLQAPTQPATVTGIPFGPPKMVKVYFQVIASSKKAIPESKEDINSIVRIVVVETTRGKEFYVCKYYSGVDSNLDGLPNSIEEWTAYKSLVTGKVVKRGKVKAPDVPKSAEIIDMTWGKWLAEFIKLYQLHALEDLSRWYEDGWDLREAIFKELANENEESVYRSDSNLNPAYHPSIWSGDADARIGQAGL